MKKTVAILILLIIIAVLAISFGVIECINLEKQRSYLNQIEEQQKRYLENIEKWTKNYNELYADYNELNQRYYELAVQKGFNEGWDIFTITAYTSLDAGCNSISSTGINIEKLAFLYNFAAVDPEVIPYGSVVLVKFDTGIEPFLAVDCGSAVKGKKIDLYFVNDLKNAFQFSKRELEVKILK